MLKDLHELHAKYYKRLLYYKGMLCILDERGSNPIRCFQAFLVLEEYVRRCQQTLPYDLSKNDCFSIIFVVF